MTISDKAGGIILSKIEVIGMTLLMLLIALALTACTAPRYAVETPECPPMPKLPVIMETELNSLSDNAYTRLVDRELTLLEYIGELKSFCTARQ